MKTFSRLAAATVFALALAAAVRAQETDVPKIEVGAQFTSLSHRQPGFSGTENLPGFGGRLSYNLNDHVALEAEINFLPSKAFTSTAAGGRAHQGQFGVKAGRRFRRFGVFGKARPGFVSFRETAVFREEQLPGQSFPTVFFDFKRKTHLSLDVGGVLEIYPTRRVLVRFDVGDTIIRYGERNSFNSPIIIQAFDGQSLRLEQQGQQLQRLTRDPAETKHNLQFGAGISFRLFDPKRGADDDASAAPPSTKDDRDVPRYEVGVQFTSLTLDVPNDQFGFLGFVPVDPGTDTESGFGGRFTYNVTNHVGLEAEGNFYPRKNFPGQNYGGYPVQAQFGAKVGKRFRHFGIFAKARPGFLSFSEVHQLVGTEQFTFVINQQTGATRTFTHGIFDDRRKTYFTTDVGGVFELYPSRRLVTRFDFGDTIIRYGLRHNFGFDFTRDFTEVPPEIKHNFQFSAGIGFRF